MRTFAVGDVQGCYDALRRLLDRLAFEPARDRLWVVGDLVNRGPHSLEVLRFCRDLGDRFLTVLGNHDLHLLAIARGHTQPRRSDTLDAVLASPDREPLLDWLQRQPLFYYDQQAEVALVHAGVPPQWSLKDCLERSAEIEQVLQSDQADHYFAHMYGNQPDRWDSSLQGTDRWRLITNYFTRMRFCTPAGQLELAHKAGPETAPVGYFPWYALPQRQLATTPILFGHWASLMGAVATPHIQALDTGCVWGGQLTAVEVGAEFRRYAVAAEPEA